MFFLNSPNFSHKNFSVFLYTFIYFQTTVLNYYILVTAFVLD